MIFNCVLPTNKAVEEKLRIEKKIFNDLVTNIGEFNKINLKVINELDSSISYSSNSSKLWMFSEFKSF